MPTLLRGALLLLGLALLTLAAWSAVGTAAFVARAQGAIGTVSRLNAGGSHPQIEFRTEAGSAVGYPQGGMIAGFRAGQSVRVLYEAADPAGSARVATFGSLWGESVLWCVAGLLLLTLVTASWTGLLPSGTVFLRGR